MIRRQESTDFSDPEERFLWAFQNLEYNGFPFLAPETVFKQWSRHLSECGFVHVSQLDGVDLDALGIEGQSIHFQPPVRGQDHGLNGAGSWIPIEDEIQEPVVPTVAQLTPAEKAAMIKDLKEEGSLD